MKRTFNKIIQAGVITACLASTSFALAGGKDDSIGAAVFNKNGDLLTPVGYRKWVFLGAPLTPNGLNGGTAAFPEFHNVYVNPDSFAIYERTGVFPDGTVIAKELVLLHKGDHKDGSHNAVSGRGFFAGEFNGMDVMVKDKKRFKDTQGWGFFNFGHHAPPYEKTARVAGIGSCAACHIANATEDMLFTKYYSILK